MVNCLDGRALSADRDHSVPHFFRYPLFKSSLPGLPRTNMALDSFGWLRLAAYSSLHSTANEENYSLLPPKNSLLLPSGTLWSEGDFPAVFLRRRSGSPADFATHSSLSSEQPLKTPPSSC